MSLDFDTIVLKFILKFYFKSVSLTLWLSVLWPVVWQTPNISRVMVLTQEGGSDRSVRSVRPECLTMSWRGRHLYFHKTTASYIFTLQDIPRNQFIHKPPSYKRMSRKCFFCTDSYSWSACIPQLWRYFLPIHVIPLFYYDDVCPLSWPFPR